MNPQQQITEPYVIAFATFTLRDDASPGGWGAIVRRAGNRASYAVHACHTTREQVSAAGIALLDMTFAQARERGIDLVWIFDDANAKTEQQRSDLSAARALARKYALTPHEPVVQIDRAGAPS